MVSSKLFNRNFSLILLSNIILGAPMPMLILLGGLAGAQLSPIAFAATMPPSVQMLAGILVATPVSLFMGRYGRRAGFLLGGMFLIMGGLLGMASLLIHSFALLNVAHFVLGAGLISLNFFRFAAAESVAEEVRSRAISLTLASGLVAAIIGPSVFSATTGLLPAATFAGAYLAIAVFGCVGTFNLTFLAKLQPAASNNTTANTTKTGIFRKPNVAFAIGAAAVAQGIMVLLMTPTALAMVGYGFHEDHASDVIRWHVIAMFAPGFFTGYLIERYGVNRIIYIGLFILGIAAAVAMVDITLLHFYGSLIALGVGWNFGFIGGTTLLQASLTADERPLVQGTNDTILACASSAASLVSGALYAGIGWPTLAAATVGFLFFIAAICFTRSRRSSVPEPLS